ncbi:hypothetical protein CRYO30217_03483 [Parvicella tangerina]|uniref:Uncharacterized protein n=1 Tax=Parvicella tangerina TaxID=2829795 RepID=A0A916JQS2_9FLAO|nr:hypothetical protein CRYO30217_03483 [Parvicella tangerina]
MFDYLKSTTSYQINPTSVGLSEMEESIIKDSINSVHQKYSTKTNNQLTSIIYVTNNKQYDKLKELLDLTGDTDDFCQYNIENDYARIALLFPNVNSILIPKKAKRSISRYVPKHLLREIDSDVNIAIEKCLVFLSYLSPTYYMENKWKPLSSIRLHEQLKNGADNTYTYKAIIKALKHGTKQTGPIIEVLQKENGTELYEIGKSSKQYRLTEAYLGAGLEEYLLQDEAIIQQRNKTFYNALFEAQNNIITSNLVSVYQQIDIPQLDEVVKYGKQLTRSNYRTKKGKILTMRNKHPNDYWRDANNRSFVEDNVELYKFLTGRGYMIPVIGKLSSGGRVVDSFNLMPSWIRSMVKIKGEPIVECDYKAMHPNLASKLYCGTGRHISHQIVADYLDVDISVAKREHLSFFNKPYYPTKKLYEKGSMVQSSVYEFYKENEPEMLSQIELHKRDSGYVATAHRLFALEVELMTEVIKQLNELGIYVLYVYDALYCAESDSQTVKQIMNDVAEYYGVNTWVE